MPRYGTVPKRRTPPDPVFGSDVLQKFINKLMYGGKKSKAEDIVYGAVKAAGEKLNLPPLEVFDKALLKITPLMEVKSRRVGGATYQIPVEVTRERGRALAMQWLREAARERSGHSMTEKLAAELMDALNNTGIALKKREDMHKTAEANKAFAHFRW
jgi:small subunit ribosomal protein S7